MTVGELRSKFPDLNSWGKVELDPLAVAHFESNPGFVELESYKLLFSPNAWNNSSCYFWAVLYYCVNCTGFLFSLVLYGQLFSTPVNIQSGSAFTEQRAGFYRKRKLQEKLQEKKVSQQSGTAEGDP